MPRKILRVIENPEKKKHQKWSDIHNRSLLDFPQPFRWGILGAVSCGKTSLILNYLAQSQPFENIFVMHPQTYNPNIDAADESINKNILIDNVDIPEYKGVQHYSLGYIPSMKYFDVLAETGKHSLFIIDDIDLNSYMKKRRDLREERVNKLFSYVSSHKNLSIIVSSQDASSQLPSFVIKMCNVVTIYKIRDEFIIQTLARKMSVSYKRLKALMELCKDKHDNITFDCTDNTPAELRFNIFTPILEQ